MLAWFTEGGKNEKERMGRFTEGGKNRQLKDKQREKEGREARRAGKKHASLVYWRREKMKKKEKRKMMRRFREESKNRK